MKHQQNRFTHRGNYRFVTNQLRHARKPSHSLRVFKTTTGQATVEYLIVGVALIVIITAFGVFSGRLQEGLFTQHAADSASHAITTNTAGSVGDVLLY